MNTETKRLPVYNWLDKLYSTVWSRSRAIVIMKDGDIVGKILVAYPKDGAGTLRAFLFDFGEIPQMGTAGGYGYDKLSAALQGMTFKGIVFTDHPENWERQLQAAGYKVWTVL